MSAPSFAGLRGDTRRCEDIATGMQASLKSSVISSADIPFDALVLDWMLPGRSGIDVLKRLRDDGLRTPVLLLTARDAVEDRVLGLDSGADDYLVKPFAFAELSTRVRALVRRGNRPEPARRRVGDLVPGS